jgi:hypothetical protein
MCATSVFDVLRMYQHFSLEMNVSALSDIGFYSPIYTSIKSTTQHWVEYSRLVSPNTDNMMYIAIPPLRPSSLIYRS